ncbi:MAG: PE PGRS family protein [Polyangiaceae bacterium]
MSDAPKLAHSARTPTTIVRFGAIVAGCFFGCAGDGASLDSGAPNSTGGTKASGGTEAQGGTAGPATTGGSRAAGGSSWQGGSVATGGLTTTNNGSAGDSNAVGGHTGVGGSTSTGVGGNTNKGGSSPGGAGGGPGGNPGIVNWGEEEDPGSKCTLTGAMPEFAALKADSKLPDPFRMLDGTRITNKSQWVCRREEILKQLFKYVYGEKPIPAKGSVSGTVSSSKISVNVSEGSKRCSFDATVDMNGATAPAPAIIVYDGGLGSSLPIPRGVAKINFRAIEGGAGAKTGPFFTFYGSDHPAGYMVAQAWQVSRIIDLLQQNPGTIDPSRIGVTGCSRNGKGAFAGGALDNRIALTIPCESGIGGTVGLRLKQQLDPGESESPYTAISYVRWLSDVALGPFTSGSAANVDNTERLPVDMHEAMALIAPRALYIVDNPAILDPEISLCDGHGWPSHLQSPRCGRPFHLPRSLRKSLSMAYAVQRFTECHD